MLSSYFFPHVQVKGTQGKSLPGLRLKRDNSPAEQQDLSISGSVRKSLGVLLLTFQTKVNEQQGEPRKVSKLIRVS